MKVVHGIAWYAPESWGGTEQYVASLAESLASLGVESVVLAPHSDPSWRNYTHRGIEVFRHPVLADGERRQALARWFRESGAGAFHQHSWTPATGMPELEAARSAGLRTVLTTHIAAPVCARGTMMRWGLTACDGEIIEQRCAACWMHSRGIGLTAARTLSIIPEAISAMAASWLGDSRLRHVFGARAEIRARRALISALVESADYVVVVCDWIKRALVSNGVPESALVLSRQGVEPSWLRPSGRSSREKRDCFRVLCAGRWERMKGQFLLLNALKLTRNPGLTIRFAAPEPSTAEATKFRDEVVEAARGDSRIEFVSPVGRDALRAEFDDADLLAVPAQWFETGPLVVLEAQAAGLPVLGSNLGGIPELVGHGVDGWLVRHDDIHAWAAHLDAISTGKLTIPARERRIRTTADVAAEMLDLYRGSTGVVAA